MQENRFRGRAYWENLQVFHYLLPGDSVNPRDTRDVLICNVHDYYNKFIVKYEGRDKDSDKFIPLVPGYNQAYFAVTNPVDLFRLMSNPNFKQLYFHEMIQSGPQKLHIDLDIKQKEWGQKFSQQLAEEIKDHVIDSILRIVPDVNIETDIIICTSHGPGKFSYHINLNNHKFPSNKHCEIVNRQIYDWLPDEVKQVHGTFDLQVTSPNQSWRMLFCNKPFQNRPKIFNKEWFYHGHPIQHKYTDPRIQVSFHMPQIELLLQFEESLIGWFTSNVREHNFEIAAPVKPRNYQSEDLEDFEVTEAFALIPADERQHFAIDKIKGSVIELKRLSPSYCPNCDRVHDNCPPYLAVIGEEQKVLIDCRRHKDESTKMRYLGKLKPHLPSAPSNATPTSDPENVVRLESNFTLEVQQKFLKKPKPSKPPYCSPHVQPEDFKNRDAVLIDSPLGTGKTSFNNKYVREKNCKRVLIIGPRQLYERAMTGEYMKNAPHLPIFSGEPFYCYLDFQDRPNTNLLNINRLVIQEESLFKLGDVVENPYDVVIIDEIESLIMQWSSKTMTSAGQFKQCVRVFEQLLLTTPVILGGDAFLSTRSTRVLRCLRPNLRVIRNTFKPPKRKAYRLPSWEALCWKALQSMQQGKRIVMVVNSAQKLNEFRTKFLQNVVHLAYDKDTPLHDRIKLQDVVKIWKEVQVVLYTSTITVGVNFDTEGVFDELFVWGSSRSCVVRDTFQSMLRVRHITSNTLYYALWSRPTSNNLPLSYSAVKQSIVDEVNKKKQLTEQYNQESMITIIWDLAPEWLKMAEIYNRLERNQKQCYV